MNFVFYPKHEYACPELKHCPHLGGANLATLVQMANDNGAHIDLLQHQVRVLEKKNSEYLQQIVELQQERDQLKRELNFERQNKFALSTSEEEEVPAAAEETSPPAADEGKEKKKRGPKFGHPGWFRRTPQEYDELIVVEAPRRCPHCHSREVQLFPAIEPYDHLQEDVVNGVYQVILYHHPAARCRACRKWVKQAGEGELLRSRIGPRLRSWAVFLRNNIGISYRKVPQILQELVGVALTPATVIAFEKFLAKIAEPLAEDIAKKIASSEGAVHADETYWVLNGQRSYYWVHGTERFIHFQFDTSRAGEVSRDLLGEHFLGTLVTDCYAGYEAHQAKAKQKCLAHLARTARDWQKVVPENTKAFVFFSRVKEWVRRGCAFYQERGEGKLTAAQLAEESAWLRAELQRLQDYKLDHRKAKTLQKRIKKHAGEWLVFVDDPRVPPTNNLAERALRPLVVMRKITYGHRSAAGAKRMAVLMTIQETARRHNRKPTEIYYHLYTRPPNEVLTYLYAGRAR